MNKEMEGKVKRPEMDVRMGTHCWNTQGDTPNVRMVQKLKKARDVISSADKEGLGRPRPEPQTD